MSAAIAQPDRRAASPYAKRLARERGIPLELLTGSGPAKRIVAADIIAFVPSVVAPAVALRVAPASAFGATVSIEALQRVLAGFAEAQSPFALEDVVLRAAGCAIDDMTGATDLEGKPIALEVKFGGRSAQLVFTDVRKQSLAPLRDRRVAAEDAELDQANLPAVLSMRLLQASGVEPVYLPLLEGRSMRLILVAGQRDARCLLSFDAQLVDEEIAAEILRRFKSYLESPLLLLA
jgi:pyruvate/2-oxoglutarate dehydrogenase complex dihydrolipoamide acyltransferase (E2) component